jgi:hypothetical protein
MLKAIETAYQGYRFRSRLEARWAVFLTAVGLRWRYEVEGFTLAEAGLYYLPDFYLPDWDVYLEVKPDLPYDQISADNRVILVVDAAGHTALGKLLLAGRALQKPETGGLVKPRLYMVCGTPGYPALLPWKGRWQLQDGAVVIHPVFAGPNLLFPIEAWSESAAGVLDLWPFYQGGVAEGPNELEAPMFPAGVSKRLYLGAGRDYASPRLNAAYAAARSARFEHGETPRIRS